jgi:hypothetical protein
MKSFVSGLMSRLKTKRSPLDVSDFLAKQPDAPSHARLAELIAKNYAKVELPAEQLSLMKQRMYFDVRYRCGAAGRCLEGDYECRFPCCFAMRPVIKGGEVFAERLGFQQLAAEKHHAIVQLCLDERLGDAEQALLALITQALAGAGGTLKAQAANSAVVGDVVVLSMWRASLLVNLDRDEAAVASLTDLTLHLPQAAVPEILACAASWAALSDMELRFWRQHVAEYPGAKTPAGVAARPPLLRRVVEACGGSEISIQHCAHAAFSKEVTAVVARAQAAQESGDATEDPMGTPVVKDSVAYYKRDAVLGGKFWDHFFTLALLPPMPPGADAADVQGDDALQLRSTPQHVLDALGRSMLLSHMAGLYGAPPGKAGSASAAPADGGDALLADQALKQEIASMPQVQRRALHRMHELLNIVREHQAAPGMPPPPPGKGGKPAPGGAPAPESK